MPAGNPAVLHLAVAAALVVSCGRGLDADDVRLRYFASTGAESYVARRSDGLELWFREPVVEATVRASRQPEVLADGEALARLEEGTRLRLPGLEAGGRHYLTVALADGARWVVAERGIPLASAQNVRDLGGYTTDDGRAVRWGAVYRSDALVEPAEADLEVLVGLDLALAIDLRGGDEAAAAPIRLPASARIAAEPIPLGEARPEEIARRFAERDIEGLDLNFQVEVTKSLLDEQAERFGAALRHVADPANRPVLLHGALGKDRVGLAAALLLRALGVTENQVIGDYHLSETYDWRRVRATSRQLVLDGVEPATLRHVIAVDPVVMREALDHLTGRYGGVEPYLLGPAGLAPGELAALREGLLQSP